MLSSKPDCLTKSSSLLSKNKMQFFIGFKNVIKIIFMTWLQLKWINGRQIKKTLTHAMRYHKRRQENSDVKGHFEVAQGTGASFKF